MDKISDMSTSHDEYNYSYKDRWLPGLRLGLEAEGCNCRSLKARRFWGGRLRLAAVSCLHRLAAARRSPPLADQRCRRQVMSQSGSARVRNRSKCVADARSTMYIRCEHAGVPWEGSASCQFGPFSIHGPCANRPTHIRYSYPVLYESSFPNMAWIRIHAVSISAQYRIRNTRHPCHIRASETMSLIRKNTTYRHHNVSWLMSSLF